MKFCKINLYFTNVGKSFYGSHIGTQTQLEVFFEDYTVTAWAKDAETQTPSPRQSQESNPTPLDQLAKTLSLTQINGHKGVL